MTAIHSAMLTTQTRSAVLMPTTILRPRPGGAATCAAHDPGMPSHYRRCEGIRAATASVVGRRAGLSFEGRGGPDLEGWGVRSGGTGASDAFGVTGAVGVRAARPGARWGAFGAGARSAAGERVAPPKSCHPCDVKKGPACGRALLHVVGVTGFEPATSSSRTKRATKLRHTPVEPAESTGAPRRGPKRVPRRRSGAGGRGARAGSRGSGRPQAIGVRVSRVASGGQANRTGA